MFNHSAAHVGSRSRQQATHVINHYTLYCIILCYNIKTFHNEVYIQIQLAMLDRYSMIDQCSPSIAESIGVWFLLVLALGLQRCTVTR